MYAVGGGRPAWRGFGSRRSTAGDGTATGAGGARRGFDALRPDLIASQETVVTDGYDQVADLFGDTVQVVHQQPVPSPDGTGCSLLAAQPDPADLER